MNCKTCHKILKDSFHPIMCDDCFDNMIEQESIEIEIKHNQNDKCFKCNIYLNSWIIENEKAVCWPSCSEKLPPPITIKKTAPN